MMHHIATGSRSSIQRRSAVRASSTTRNARTYCEDLNAHIPGMAQLCHDVSVRAEKFKVREVEKDKESAG